MHDFLDNLGAQQYEKMRKRDARKEKYYNSESEGKEFDQEIEIWQTSKYSEEYDEEFWKDYSNNTKEKKNNS